MGGFNGVVVEGGDRFEGVAGVAGFFAQFASGGYDGIFAGIDTTGGQFEQNPFGSMAVLPHKNNAIVGRDGQDQGDIGAIEEIKILNPLAVG
jgi:hypothetical protein